MLEEVDSLVYNVFFDILKVFWRGGSELVIGEVVSVCGGS